MTRCRPRSTAARLVSDWSDEETDEPLLADHRNYYKVEKWSRDELQQVRVAVDTQLRKRKRRGE